MRQRMGLPILVAAAMVAGCGADGDDESRVEVQGTAAESADVRDRPPSSVRVRATEFDLSPREAFAPEAGVVEVEVVNAGSLEHALAVAVEGEVHRSDEIQPGRSAVLEVPVEETGTYTWWCPVADHRERGMEGRLTVGGARARGDG